MHRTFTVVVVRDGDSFIAYIPVIPGCIVQEETVGGAIATAQRVGAAMIEIMVEDGLGIPEEDRDHTVIAAATVAIPALVESAA